MRIDLIARETHGKYATLYRVYINYRRFYTIRGTIGKGFENSDGTSKKDAELEEKYGIKFLTKETDYYDLVTAIVPDELVEIDEENQVIIIDLEKSRKRKV